jgi:hypothetical protein
MGAPAAGELHVAWAETHDLELIGIRAATNTATPPTNLFFPFVVITSLHRRFPAPRRASSLSAISALIVVIGGKPLS